MDGHFIPKKRISWTGDSQTTEDNFIDAAYFALRSGLPLERAIEILGEVAHWKDENWGVTH